MSVKIPDRGYCIGTRNDRYDACFKKKGRAQRAAVRLANETYRDVEIVQVQNRGNERFIVDVVQPRRGRY